MSPYFVAATAMRIDLLDFVPLGLIVKKIKAKKEKEKLQKQLRLEYPRLVMKQDAVVKALQKENEQLKSGKKQNKYRLKSLALLNRVLNDCMKSIEEYCQ